MGKRKKQKHPLLAGLNRGLTKFGLGILFLVSQLPLRFQYFLGTHLGRLLFLVLRRRRNIVETNISLAFSHLSEKEQHKLSRQVFEENAIGFLEAAYSWWNDPQKILSQADFHGLEFVDKALEQGRGVLLIGGHFTNLELAALLVGQKIDMDVTYRKQNNATMDEIIFRKRQNHFKHVIERSNIRQFLKNLKANRVIWYAPDQDYGRKHSVFAPFFGVPAATVSATSKILNFKQSPALFLSHQRDENNRYQITISEFDCELPTGDTVKDANIINRKIEHWVNKYPAQYMWTHRRYKTRPEGQKRPYKK